MNKILIYILLFLTFGCVEKKKEKESKKINKEPKEMTRSKPEKIELKTKLKAEIKKPDSIFIDSTNFKYFDLKEFDLRDWDSGKMNEQLKSPSKKKLIEYMQHKRLLKENIYPNSWKYFSIQKNETSEKIITIIEGDENCCSDLHYLVFNKQNELLSDNIVAGTGGDGMWAYDQYGEFSNDSTYVLTRIDMEEIDLENGGTEIHVDSMITNYRYYKNKPFEKLTERKYNKVKKN